ncbi:hypothetical protein EKH55_1495 [Sinorhizobium alkalisoli]|nr:hypothetical protein EKH55_1495 [Sinorhizobium alkalisoli]
MPCFGEPTFDLHCPVSLLPSRRLSAVDPARPQAFCSQLQLSSVLRNPSSG